MHTMLQHALNHMHIALALKRVQQLLTLPGTRHSAYFNHQSEAAGKAAPVAVPVHAARQIVPAHAPSGMNTAKHAYPDTAACPEGPNKAVSCAFGVYYAQTLCCCWLFALLPRLLLPQEVAASHNQSHQRDANSNLEGSSTSRRDSGVMLSEARALQTAATISATRGMPTATWRWWQQQQWQQQQQQETRFKG
jgi:hypothetical protein